MKLEVRCCCDPRKIRGWLNVDEYEGLDSISFPAAVGKGKIDLKIRSARLDGKIITALVSKDMTISRLRKINGFIENHA